MILFLTYFACLLTYESFSEMETQHTAKNETKTKRILGRKRKRNKWRL